jgi:copper transport protein
VRADLADGTYTVAWRVVSADTHPVFGAFVFHVGAPGANPAGIAEQVLEESAPSRAVSLVFTTVRFLSYALIILCAGGAAALALVLTRAADRVRKQLLAVLASLAGGLAVVSLAGILLQGSEASGFGFAAVDRWSVIESVMETRFGQVWLARAVIAVLLAGLVLAARRRRGDWALDAALLACVALVISPAAAGHANTSGALAFVMDVIHVQAVSVWIGGLAFLLLALHAARADRWKLAESAVPRFSTIAVLSVGALLVGGVVNGYLQIRTWNGLLETTYGRLVLVKAGLLLPILALGAYNNRRAVPRLRTGRASVPERRRFLQTTAAELGLVVAVLAVTAVLVAEPPAHALVAPTGPIAQTTDLGDLELNLVVDPAVAGPNDVHLYTLTRSGQPSDLDEIDVSARLASQGIGPLRFEARHVAPGHYLVVGADLPLPGDWQLEVEARRGEFELLTATLSVPIRQGS